MNLNFTSRSLTAAVVLAALTNLCAQPVPPLESTITIYGGPAGVLVSPTLYGIFYEDINYAADGGLYAEMIQNRSFDYHRLLEGPGKNFTPTTAWETVSRGGRKAEMKVEIYLPQHAQNPNYLLVTLKGDAAVAGTAGVANTGFDGGLSVKQGAEYDISLHTRRHSGEVGPLRLTLETTNGTVLAEAELPAPGPDWTKQAVTLRPNQSEAKARLVITAAQPGSYLLDMVSMFPRDTFRGRKNGLRKDLAEAIAALKPGILRFPGGCLVHGSGLDNAYRWKETVGPVEQRRAKANRWGYHQTFGLGYFEFFQFCEDIGAAPLPILPAGVSCGFNKPFEVASEAQLADMIQDAIDLVEFANGPVTSAWGGVRARMGHPAPFNLKYLGLGNEEHDTTTFRTLFPRFVQALRAKHPEIIIVGTSGLGPNIPLFDLMEGNGVDISDEHYYMPPEWFIEQRGRFDSFPRGRTKIFVGEYASNGNRQFNAVAEAVYLTGIERNADLVVMGAYAPLLSRYGFCQWPRANLIWFDDATVVRTPSYHVQQLFATHLGDRYLSNTVQFAEGALADGRPPVLAVSPTRATKAGQVFLKIANPMNVPVQTRVLLEEMPAVQPLATLSTLAAAKDAENDRAQPDRVAPVRSEIKVARQFELTVPAMAVQVLTLETAPR